MKSTPSILISSLILAACLLLSSTSLVAEAVVGETAPAFTLQDIDGNERSLDEFKGKTVVLEWTNHQCPYVKKHYGSQNMQSLQKKYVSDSTVWLTINSSAPGKQGHLTAESAKSLVAEQNSQATAYLLDPSGKVGKSYGARTTPHMYIVDESGKLVYAGAIDDNSSSRQSAIEGSLNYVAAALDELNAGEKIQHASTEPYGCSVKYSS